MNVIIVIMNIIIHISIQFRYPDTTLNQLTGFP